MIRSCRRSWNGDAIYTVIRVVFHEKETSAFIADKLAEFGIEVRRSTSGYGVTGILRGHRPGKTVVLRADMDALPIKEENKNDYVSQNEGVMHACGHDGHTSILLGVAFYYSSRLEELEGELRFLFSLRRKYARVEHRG